MSLGNTTTSRVRREIRTCKHPACGKKFEGSPTSLYCAEHRSRKSRAQRFVPKKTVKPEESNLLVQNSDNKPAQKTLACSLPHCHRDYTFTVYPDHDIYPMYCELHRTEYKRRFFTRMMSSGKKLAYEAPNYEKWGDYETQFEKYALNQPHLVPFPAKKPRNQPPLSSQG